MASCRDRPDFLHSRAALARPFPVEYYFLKKGIGALDVLFELRNELEMGEALATFASASTRGQKMTRVTAFTHRVPH